jgi:hypothetical protein
VHGVWAAPYWSLSAQAYIVPDDNTQTLTLTPVWTNNNTSFSAKFDLTITGDQLTNKDDSLTISESSSGLQVILNGEVFAFDSGKIRNITIHLGSGNNTLTLDDSADTTDHIASTTGPITVTGSSVTGFPAGTISYDAGSLEHLIINGGQGTTNWIINGTAGSPFLGTTIVGGGGTNTFAVQATNAPLTIDGNGSQDTVNVVESASTLHNLAGLVTVNGNGHTSMTLDDSSVQTATVYAPTIAGVETITYKPGPATYVLNRPPAAVGDLALTRTSKTLVMESVPYQSPVTFVDQSQAK